MTLQPRDVIESSLLFRIISHIWSWAKQSLTIRLLNDERVLVGGLIIFLLISIVRVLSSSANTTIQFFSFALLFFALTAVTWNYTKPLSNA